MTESVAQFAWCLHRMAQLLGVRLDAVALDSLVREIGDARELAGKHWEVFCALVGELGFERPFPVADSDDPEFPLLAYGESGWSVVTARTAAGEWDMESFDGATVERKRLSGLEGFLLLRLNATQEGASGRGEARAFRLIRRAFAGHWGAIGEGVLATVIGNVLALGTAFFSMQVYDRVIPSQGQETLIVLTIGVLLTIAFDLVIKFARARVMEHSTVVIDSELSRAVFRRLLAIRLDQLPRMVGTLSAQLRGYETVRGFVSAASLYFLVDTPFALAFVIVIALIGGWPLAAIPAIALALALVIGLALRRKMERHAKSGVMAANRKMGLLVETVEGAEAVKACGGGWRLLSRWADTTAEVIDNEMRVKGINEWVGFVGMLCQQVSYVMLVAVGSWLAIRGELTMGGLIACSILSGRALAPVIAIPGFLMQWANAKAALDGLEKIWALQMDNHAQERPLVPQDIRGGYMLEDVRFAYPGTRMVLAVPHLEIAPGQKVGVIGPVGAGKSTLLRLLSGLYPPQDGRVYLDDMDISHISRTVVCENVGYIQQDPRLFSGSLRDNLILGMPDPGDSAILDAAGRTGLKALIAGHPKGLGLEIAEGGAGLSGGQRQLVSLTRLLLTRPSVWLMDEPTASMDELLEARCVAAIRHMMSAESTLVLVTHKPSMLSLVDRLIVVNHHTIVLDGPTAEVLKHLQQHGQPQPQAGQRAPLRGAAPMAVVA